MANGRMLNKKICADKRVDDLDDPWSMMAFERLITHADREGRTPGDPAVVKSLVYPRRRNITPEMMEGYILQWFEAGLVVWYEADGDLWIWFPNFEKNQPGMRKDKEAPSVIPAPTEEGTELVRSRYGVSPEKVGVKLREEKFNEIEGKGNADPPISTPNPPLIPEKPELKIVYEVTGLLPDYMNEENVIRNIRIVHNKRHLPVPQLTEYLKEVYEAWCAGKTTDGRPYNPANWHWLDWAVTGFRGVGNAGKTNPSTYTEAQLEQMAADLGM